MRERKKRKHIFIFEEASTKDENYEEINRNVLVGWGWGDAGLLTTALRRSKLLVN